MPPLFSFLFVFMLAGCGSKNATSDTAPPDSTASDSGISACEPDEDEVDCCDGESGELYTCCCYEEACEEVMDYTINDDGSCTQTVNS